MSARSADPSIASSGASVLLKDFVVAEQAAAKSWRADWIALAVGLLVLLIPFSATFQHGATQMDEGTLLVYPEMVQRGAIPYRDFETFYGPANTYLLAAVYTVSGVRIEAERVVGLCYRVLILVALFGTTRRWGTGMATACMFIAGMLLLPSGVAAFAWYGALACAIYCIWAMINPEPWRCFVGGWFAATAAMFRPDIGPATMLVALILIWPLLRSQQAKFGIGVIIGLSPLAVISYAAGPVQLFNNLFLYPVTLSAPARRLALLTAEPTLLRLFFAQLAAAIVNIVAAVLAVKARPSGRRERAFLALAILGAGIIPQAWQRLDLTHLFFVVFLIIGLLPLSIYFLAARKSENRRRRWLVLASAAAVVFFLAALAPSLPTSDFALFGEALRTSLAGSVSVQRGSRSFPVGSPQQVVEVGRMLDTLE
ncbi:MAG TPA: hypothetical protein VGH00_04040, partial [Chthoniobacterales bacterium]